MLNHTNGSVYRKALVALRGSALSKGIKTVNISRARLRHFEAQTMVHVIQTPECIFRERTLTGHSYLHRNKATYLHKCSVLEEKKKGGEEEEEVEKAKKWKMRKNKEEMGKGNGLPKI